MALYQPGEILVPRSGLPGLAWPAMPPARHQAVLTLLAQMDYSQWWSSERIAEAQRVQLANVLLHAQRHSPWYRKTLAGVDPMRLDEQVWQAIPPLERTVLQARASALNTPPPKEHGNITKVTSSGSTGRPVTVLGTQLSQVFWDAITARELLWHRRDVASRLAVIKYERKLEPGGTASERVWAAGAEIIGPPGPADLLDVRAPISRQLDWLERVQPATLMTYPSNLHHLALAALDRALELPLRGITTLSEVLRPDTRAVAREAFGAEICDVYSAQECGYIALQCPDHTHYHVQSESVRVDVVRDDGSPVEAGEVGRVLVTSLTGFGTPLIRYALGDYAEVGPPCPCGRGLPVLTRVLGRERNLLVTADGDRVWPHFGTRALTRGLPILQHQLVQTEVDALELRLVPSRPLTAEEVAQLQRHADRQFDGYRVALAFPQAIERSAGGKFEDFICLVSP